VFVVMVLLYNFPCKLLVSVVQAPSKNLLYAFDF